MIVVKPHEIWSASKVVVTAFALGMVTNAAEHTLMPKTGPISLIAGLSIYLLPALALFVWKYRLMVWSHAIILYPISISAGWSLAASFEHVVELDFLGFVLVWIGNVFVMGVLVPLSILFHRVVFGPVIMDDTNVCRSCGYDLSHNVSRTCPECGDLSPSN